MIYGREADEYTDFWNKEMYILDWKLPVESVTEKLKGKDQMAWIRAVNSIYHRAEEIVLNEILFLKKKYRRQLIIFTNVFCYLIVRKIDRYISIII